MRICPRALPFIAGSILSALAGTGRAQSFDVASIHENKSGAEHSDIGDPRGGRFTSTNATLRSLIRNAWNIRDFQLSGLPGWADHARYDIEAKANPATQITPELFQAMLQNLLSDRFRMKIHRVTREMPVYNLLVTDGGAKVRPAASNGEPVINGGAGPGKTALTFKRAPMSLLAFYLGGRLERTVVDKTNLSGLYDFELEWAPDISADSSEPSLFTALKAQLGLRLASARGPVKILVIDRVEALSEN